MRSPSVMVQTSSRRETGRTTQAETRYGCFLPDLTGLARGLSAADLPPALYQARHPPRRERHTLRQAALALAMHGMRVSEDR